MTLEAHSQPGSAVVVLGMARSGTSAVARLLALLGVELGPEEALLAPAGENSRGFFEHRGLMRVNKELLQRMGGSWSRPPRLAQGWQRDPGLRDLRDGARQLMQADFAGARLWGFKDPRTSLTLPFWAELLEEAGWEARYVICHRRPLDSARSLHARDVIRLDEGVALWTRYTAAALAHTAGRPRILISYERLFGEREALVGELAGFLDVPERAASPAVRAQIEGWIQAELRHHAGSLRELLEHPAVSPDAQALHLLLKLADADGADGLHDALTGMAQTLLRREAARAALAPAGVLPASALTSTAAEGGSPAHHGPGAGAGLSDSPKPLPRPPAQAAQGLHASIVLVLGDDPWGAMACLESLCELAPDSPAHEIVLVDNESSGLRGTLDALQGEVRVVRLPERLAAPAALQAGVDVAGGQVVVCLAEPLLLAPEALTAMCAEASGRGAAQVYIHVDAHAGAHGEVSAKAHADAHAGASAHANAASAQASPPPAPLCRRGPGDEAIEVSIVIPTLDAASAEVRECLRAVQATVGVAHEIIVLDNGAPPQGFTAPVNAALRAARGRHLVVMNDDVRVLDGWWEPLADALHDGAPLVFPLTVEGRMRWEFAAWCFAMSRETFERMASGPDEFFDPGMVVWCQDADLRKRLCAQGTPPLCVPESRIRHAGSRTVRVAAPHDALRNWIHAQAGRDTALFRARHPEERSAGDGLPPGVPALRPEHAALALSEGAIEFRAQGPAWESHTLPWPGDIGHFFLAGEIEVRSRDSVQDILVRAVFAGEERELYWMNLVPGIVGLGRTAFSIPRERARAIRLAPGEAPAEWSLVRSLRLCARSRLRGALRRSPSAPGATAATLTGLRILASPLSTPLPAEIAPPTQAIGAAGQVVP